MGHIYVIKNDINNKLYVGKTVGTILNRWYKHLDAYLTNDWHLYKAMRKYGVEHFWIEEIETCEEDVVNEREIYWIAKLNTIQNGYNMTIGGDGRTFISRDLVKELWEKGFSVNYISNKLNCWYSTIISILKELNIYNAEEIKRRKTIDIANKLTKDVIYQYNEQGIPINSFCSCKEAEVLTGIRREAITTALQTHCGAGGFLWRYGNEPAPKPRKVKTCKKRQIEQIDLTTGQVINTYDGPTEAAKAVGADASAICKVCKGKRNKTHGYSWRYKEEQEN